MIVIAGIFWFTPERAPNAEKDRNSPKSPVLTKTRQIQETPAGKFVFARFGATLTLLPPGAREANRFWMIRGKLSDGRRLEVSTKAAKKIHAVRIAFELAVWRSRTRSALNSPSSPRRNGMRRRQTGGRVRGS
jgi:hypothetical protein